MLISFSANTGDILFDVLLKIIIILLYCVV